MRVGRPKGGLRILARRSVVVTATMGRRWWGWLGPGPLAGTKKKEAFFLGVARRITSGINHCFVLSRCKVWKCLRVCVCVCESCYTANFAVASPDTRSCVAGVCLPRRPTLPLRSLRCGGASEDVRHYERRRLRRGHPCLCCRCSAPAGQRSRKRPRAGLRERRRSGEISCQRTGT